MIADLREIVERDRRSGLRRLDDVLDIARPRAPDDRNMNISRKGPRPFMGQDSLPGETRKLVGGTRVRENALFWTALEHT